MYEVERNPLNISLLPSQPYNNSKEQIHHQLNIFRILDPALLVDQLAL